MASAEDVIRELGGLVLGDRVERMAAAAAARSFRILPIVEGLYDMGNLAAVCRTSDGAPPRGACSLPQFPLFSAVPPVLPRLLPSCSPPIPPCLPPSFPCIRALRTLSAPLSALLSRCVRLHRRDASSPKALSCDVI